LNRNTFGEIIKIGNFKKNDIGFIELLPQVGAREEGIGDEGRIGAFSL